MGLVGQARVSRKELGTKKWARVRRAVLLRDNHTCAYCGQEATTVDHVIARKHGGDMFDESNLVAACKRCNSAKGSKSGVFLAQQATPPVFSRRPSPVTASEVHHSPFNAD